MLGAVALTWAASDPLGFDHLWGKKWFRVIFVFLALAALSSPPRPVRPQLDQTRFTQTVPRPKFDLSIQSADEILGPSPAYPSVISARWTDYITCTDDESRGVAVYRGDAHVSAVKIERHCYKLLIDYAAELEQTMSHNNVLREIDRIERDSIAIDQIRIEHYRAHPELR